MGTWGPAIFSDDTACEVRDDYVELLGSGISDIEASERLIKSWEENFKYSEIENVFWLALAVTQWKHGRLEDFVKEKAVQVIESGKDLDRWKEEYPNNARKREQYLEKLKAKLLLPQPQKKKVSKQFKDYTNWKKGDVISYRLKSTDYILMRVIGYHEDKGGKSPVFELLDWVGQQIPDKKEIKKIPIKRSPTYSHITQFLIGRLKEEELPIDRVKIIAKRLKCAQKCNGYMGFLWRTLDRQLEEVFGI